MKKVLLLVMCGPKSKDVYVRLERAIRETWGRVSHTVYYDYGAVPDYTAETGTLTLRGHEDFRAMCLDKTLQAFAWAAKEMEFDYVFRSNLGGYIDYQAALEWVEDRPATGYYCGWSTDELAFASGSGFFLSRDLVSLLGREAGSVPRTTDDIAVGQFLQARGFRVAPAIRVDIKEGQKQSVLQGYEHKPMQFNRRPYHYRVRSGNDSRDVDVEVIKRLHTDINAYA